MTPLTGTRVRGLFGSATVMYMVALGMSGLAVLLTVALPPPERGLLVATTASATMGVATGGLSMETFLLARGRAWLAGHAGRRSAAIYAGTVPLSALAGWAIGVWSAEADAGLAALGAALVAAGVLPAASGLTHDGFFGVYLLRALLAAATPALYAALILGGGSDAGPWLAVWLASQAGLAAAMWIRFGRPLVRLLRRRSGDEGLGRLARAHGGAVAHVVAYRFDQIALARYQGAEALAVYSLAVAALEFAQAGAVVGAQRVLGDHSADAGARLPAAVRRAVVHAVAIGVLAVAGLGVIALWSADYRAGLLLGAALLPRTVAVVVTKILNARLVNRHGEGLSGAIAAGTGLAAAVGFVAVVPAFGGGGAAVVAAVVFGVEAALVWAALRRRA